MPPADPNAASLSLLASAPAACHLPHQHMRTQPHPTPQVPIAAQDKVSPEWAAVQQLVGDDSARAALLGGAAVSALLRKRGVNVTHHIGALSVEADEGERCLQCVCESRNAGLMCWQLGAGVKGVSCSHVVMHVRSAVGCLIIVSAALHPHHAQSDVSSGLLPNFEQRASSYDPAGVTPPTHIHSHTRTLTPSPPPPLGQRVQAGSPASTSAYGSRAPPTPTRNASALPTRET
jgi:hypothetical protein